jgi:hypothetical protein
MYLFIIVFFVVLSVLFLGYRQTRRSSDKEKIQRLLRQTARWSTAAEQDTNPYIRNLHATYAVGYLLALREIYSDQTILRLTGVDVRKLETEVNKVMDNAMLEVAKVCPEGQPKSEFLALLSKQGLVK